MRTQSITVGQLVAERPARSKVLEKFGIDYCCGGKRELDDVCAELGLDPAVVQHELDQCDKTAPADKDWLNAGLTELCDHIEQTHHKYLTEELPALAQLVEKVASVHGENHPGLREVARIYAELREELELHKQKEEQILFPFIRELEKATEMPCFHCGSVAHPIAVMEQEHDRAGSAIHQIRALTHDFKVPEDACNSYRAMLHRLAHFEEDLHQHVHKENNILFPRAVALEQKLMK